MDLRRQDRFTSIAHSQSRCKIYPRPPTPRCLEPQRFFMKKPIPNLPRPPPPASTTTTTKITYLHPRPYSCRFPSSYLSILSYHPPIYTTNATHPYQHPHPILSIRHPLPTSLSHPIPVPQPIHPSTHNNNPILSPKTTSFPPKMTHPHLPHNAISTPVPS